MLFVVPQILIHQWFVPLEHQQVFCIPLCGFGEVEAARDQCCPIDDHDLVMSNGMFGIDQYRDTGVGKEGARRISRGGIALVQDSFDFDAALSGVDEGLGDRLAGEAVGLDQDLLFRFTDIRDHRLGGATVG